MITKAHHICTAWCSQFHNNRKAISRWLSCLHFKTRFSDGITFTCVRIHIALKSSKMSQATHCLPHTMSSLWFIASLEYIVKKQSKEKSTCTRCVEVPPARIELTTSGSQHQCSTTELWGLTILLTQMVNYNFVKHNKFFIFVAFSKYYLFQSISSLHDSLSGNIYEKLYYTHY